MRNYFVLTLWHSFSFGEYLLGTWTVKIVRTIPLVLKLIHLFARKDDTNAIGDGTNVQILIHPTIVMALIGNLIFSLVFI